ncbi:MAG: hypothetical protein LIP16_01900 [Clostridium sp.]|nr:hypothetical protein [Clostridium sp.]
MKRFALFFVTAALVLTVLFTVVADVNHGHGPGHGEHGEAAHGEEIQGNAAHGEEIQGNAAHGEEIQGDAAHGADPQEEGDHGGETQLLEAAH